MVGRGRVGEGWAVGLSGAADVTATVGNDAAREAER